MPTPIANTFAAAALYQETPDAFLRLGEPQMYRPLVLFDAPVGYWRLDETTGTVATDSSTGAHNGTYTGGFTLAQPGALADGDRATLFDGSSGFVDMGNVGSLAFTGAFSLEAWIKTTAASYAIIASKTLAASTNDGYVLLMDAGSGPGKIRFYCVVTGGGTILWDFKTTLAYNDGNWHHVVATWNGTTGANGVKIFVDGVQVAQATAAAGTPGTPATPFRLGTYSDLAIQCFPGALDDVAAYNFALTSTQVGNHFTGRGAAGPIARDLSLNTFDGDVLGGAAFGQAGWSGDGTTAALFNGSTGNVSLGTVSPLAYINPFSVMVAFKISAAPGATSILVGKSGAGAVRGWDVAMTTAGAIRFDAYTSAGGTVFSFNSGATNYADNAWHVAICVYDPLNAAARIYVDATLKNSATPSGQIGSNSLRAMIGAYDNGGTAASFFGGTIGEVASYSSALKQTQVTALIAARNKVTSDKALMQCRSGLARSGASRSGFYRSRNIVLLNGVDVTANIWKKTLKATDILNEQPDTASLTLFDKTGALSPATGNTLICADGALNNRYFGGTLVKTTRKSVKNQDGASVAVKLFDLAATDWTWLLNKYLVTKQYAAGTAGHVIVLDIMSTFVPAGLGFTTGKVKTSAPSLTAPLKIKGIPVGDALSYVCQATVPNWQWYPDPAQAIHYFDVETNQRPQAIRPKVYTYDRLDYTSDITQIRTRIVCEGGGARTTAPVAVGATSIPVDECAWYSATGGKVISSGQSTILTYTGVSAASGPGNITGVPASSTGSVTVALLQGDSLNVWVITDNAAAQTALGAMELTATGAITDGIHEKYLAVTNGTIAQCTQANNAELDAYDNANVSGTLWSTDKMFRSGKTLLIDLAARGITSEVTIQQVTRSLLTVDRWQYEVTFATVWRNWVHILKRLRKVGRN